MEEPVKMLRFLDCSLGSQGLQSLRFSYLEEEQDVGEREWVCVQEEMPTRKLDTWV